MDVDYWGPHGWQFLHTLTFNYPDEPSKKTKQVYKKYFTLTGDILPCKYCRKSYNEFIKQIPIDPALESRKTLTKWFYNIHNMVNDKLRKQGKTIKNPSFSDVCKHYESKRATCSKIKDTCK